MGQYELAWKERKSFLVVSAIIGGIIALITDVLILRAAYEEMDFGQIIIGSVACFVIMACIFIPIVTVVRMMGKRAEGFAIGILCGLWSTMVSSLLNFGPGMVIGILEMIVFGFLFAAVAAGYCIYLPVSSIYYYVKYRQEKALATAA